jgi:hypothetical protein
MPIVLSGSLELTGSVVASGNFTTTGNITAQTLVVQTITSSINYITGSSDFGSLQSNRHTFTGSFYQTGSSANFSGNVFINNTFGGAQLVVADSAKASNGTPLTLSSTDASNQMQLVVQRISNSYFGIQSVEQSVGYKNIVLQANGGNVGIGCVSPSGKLQVANSATQYMIYSSTGNVDVYSPEGNSGYVRLGSAYNLNGIYGSCGISYITTGASYHTFYTTDGLSERMKINNSGSVIIGSGSLVSHAGDNVGGLIVKGLNSCRGLIEVWDGSCGKAVFQQVGGTTYIGNLYKGTNGGSLRFLVNGDGGSATEAVIINCLGRVLVNNNSPVGTGADYSRMTISGTCSKTTSGAGVGNNVLHLTSCENDTPFGIKFAINGDTCSTLRYVSIQTGDHNISNQGNIVFQSSGGNVGIGINNPEYKLHLCSPQSVLKLTSSTATFGSPGINLLQGAIDTVITATNTGLEVGTWSNHPIIFRTIQQERVRISNGGLTVCGTIVNSATAGSTNYTLDTMNAYQSIANGGFVDFDGMSGFLMVNNWTNGATTLFVMGGGNTGVVGTITGTAGTTHHNPNVGGYRWCNNYGSTANFGFQVFRTRNTA